MSEGLVGCGFWQCKGCSECGYPLTEQDIMEQELWNGSGLVEEDNE